MYSYVLVETPLRFWSFRSKEQSVLRVQCLLDPEYSRDPQRVHKSVSAIRIINLLSKATTQLLSTYAAWHLFRHLLDHSSTPIEKRQ